MTVVPDYVPMLIPGAGQTPTDGGCLVQIANWLYNPELWTDEAVCVDSLLTTWAIMINDVVDTEARHQLALLAPRLAGSKLDYDGKWSEANRAEYNRIARELATWRNTHPCPARFVYSAQESYLGKPGGYHGISMTYNSTIKIVGTDQDCVDWLTAYIDEFDRLTGRTDTPPLSKERWMEIKELVGQ